MQKKTLGCGVTTLRDLGSSDNIDFAMRHLINRGAMEGPRMFVAGNGLHISNELYELGQSLMLVNVMVLRKYNELQGSNWLQVPTV